MAACIRAMTTISFREPCRIHSGCEKLSLLRYGIRTWREEGHVQSSCVSGAVRGGSLADGAWGGQSRSCSCRMRPPMWHGGYCCWHFMTSLREETPAFSLAACQSSTGPASRTASWGLSYMVLMDPFHVMNWQEQAEESQLLEEDRASCHVGKKI